MIGVFVRGQYCRAVLKIDIVVDEFLHYPDWWQDKIFILSRKSYCKSFAIF